MQKGYDCSSCQLIEPRICCEESLSEGLSRLAQPVVMSEGDCLDSPAVGGTISEAWVLDCVRVEKGS